MTRVQEQGVSLTSQSACPPPMWPVEFLFCNFYTALNFLSLAMVLIFFIVF